MALGGQNQSRPTWSENKSLKIRTAREWGQNKTKEQNTLYV